MNFLHNRKVAGVVGKNGAPSLSIGAIKTGYIWRKGDVVKSWKKRYFVLRDSLLYFASEDESKPKGEIRLDYVEVEKVHVPNHQYTFIIKHAHRNTHCLMADNYDQMEEWIDAILIARSRHMTLVKKELENNASVQRILTQFENLNANSKDMVETLMANDFQLLGMVCKLSTIRDSPSLARSLVIMFIENHRELELIDWVVQTEVTSTQTANILFRGDSFASRVMTAYGAFAGADYLMQVLTKPLKKVMDNEEPCEIDSRLLKPEQNAKKSVDKFIELTESILTAILESANYIPTEFRKICFNLYTSVTDKFPARKLTVVSGFIFLRFYCPAVASPTTFGLIDDVISPTKKRFFMNAAKTLQKLANGLRFHKEDPMYVLNPLIEKHLKSVSAFLQQLTILKRQQTVVAKASHTNSEQALDVMQGFLRKRALTICTQMSKLDPPHQAKQRAEVNITHEFQRKDQLPKEPENEVLVDLDSDESDDEAYAQEIGNIVEKMFNGNEPISFRETT